MNSRTVLALAAVVSLLALPAVAENRLPAKQRTLLLFKSLTYDNNISRGRDMLRVGVVAQRGSSEGESVAREMESQIRSVQNMKVSGMKISGELVAASAFEAARKHIEDKKVNILYLTPGMDRLLDGICDLAAKKKILVISGEAEHAQKCAAVTFVLKNGKPRILVNRKQAAAQGAAFREELLKVAEIVQ